MLYLLALAAAAPVAPPPPIVAAPPPPMIVPVGLPEPPRTMLLDVTVRRESRILWAGSLRMATNGSASYQQQSEQTVGCPTEERGRQSAQFNEKLRISLRAIGYPRDRLQVGVEWQRLADADASPEALCAATGTRTVSIESQVRFSPGKPMILNGDAGLQVTILAH